MKRRHMKLPNGFGQITKLSKKNLRKPYRAMITVGFDPETGRPIQKLLPPNAYFETYNDAYTALLDYSRSPNKNSRFTTLKEVYESWSAEAFKNIAHGTITNYQSQYNYFKNWENMKMCEIKPAVIKDILSQENMPHSVTHHLKMLLNVLFDYAVENEIVDKNYSRLTNTKNLAAYQVEKGHIAFNDDELHILWSNSSDPMVKWILINIYTGFRPSELVEIKLDNIHFDENIIIGGKKTANGKDRTVPIHSAIKGFLIEKYNIAKNNGYETLGDNSYKMLRKQLKELIVKYQLNENHSPHDCRKTFVTLAKKYQLDEYAIKRIIGHSIKDLTEKVYTERSNEWLISEIEKIKCMNGV